MRICVTCDSESSVIDEIYFYCQTHDIVMYPGRYIVLDNHYYTWRIESDWTRSITWLLLNYGEHLVIY